MKLPQQKEGDECRMDDLDGRSRKDVETARDHGYEVEVVLKEDKWTGRLTKGKIQDILTKSEHHPRGIKVSLTDERIGRVQIIHSERKNP